MTLQSPFALFVVTKEVDTEYLNESLRRAWQGNFEAGWDLWVASDSHGDAPKHRDDNKLPDGTVPPINADFQSPWTDRSLQECAKWLQNAPDEVALNSQYFTAMDEHSKEDDTMLVCRIVGSGSDGDIDVEYFPQPVDQIAMEMATNEGLKFDEKAANYQRARMMDGKPDRSKAGPYQ